MSSFHGIRVALTSSTGDALPTYPYLERLSSSALLDSHQLRCCQYVEAQPCAEFCVEVIFGGSFTPRGGESLGVDVVVHDEYYPAVPLTVVTLSIRENPGRCFYHFVHKDVEHSGHRNGEVALFQFPDAFLSMADEETEYTSEDLICVSVYSGTTGVGRTFNCAPGLLAQFAFEPKPKKELDDHFTRHVLGPIPFNDQKRERLPRGISNLAASAQLPGRRMNPRTTQQAAPINKPDPTIMREEEEMRLHDIPLHQEDPSQARLASRRSRQTTIAGQRTWLTQRIRDAEQDPPPPGSRAAEKISAYKTLVESLDVMLEHEWSLTEKEP
jgi:hypothetical protein